MKRYYFHVTFNGKPDNFQTFISRIILARFLWIHSQLPLLLAIIFKMGNTYTQISIQVIFAVRGRKNFIAKSWRDALHEYIAGIIRKEAMVLAVGGWSDHVHIFFALPPTSRISDLVQKVKSNSSRWINEQKFVDGRFEWQKGYGAFSYGRSQRDAVIKYIINQEQHHKTKAFQEEYLYLLNKFEVIYDQKYLFEFYD